MRERERVVERRTTGENGRAVEMRQEDVKAVRVEASKRLFGQQGGGTAHPWCALPFSPMTMASGRFILVAVITYFTLHAKKKPKASVVGVADVAAGKVEGMRDPSYGRPKIAE
uniref:Uncharacterized protein n=1 Tax=Nelumbo nucifera TaxID=4432 RepID=A0A822ZK88_NELNU|nr:TPA_asm: hypothetical protein HUJ06_002009 [Nelumbo nucifera]